MHGNTNILKATCSNVLFFKVWVVFNIIKIKFVVRSELSTHF